MMKKDKWDWSTYDSPVSERVKAVFSLTSAHVEIDENATVGMLGLSLSQNNVLS